MKNNLLKLYKTDKDVDLLRNRITRLKEDFEDFNDDHKYLEQIEMYLIMIEFLYDSYMELPDEMN